MVYYFCSTAGSSSVPFTRLLLFLAILGIRLILQLYLRNDFTNRPFRASIRESWLLTKSRLFAIMGQFIVIGGTIFAFFFFWDIISLLSWHKVLLKNFSELRIDQRCICDDAFTRNFIIQYRDVYCRNFLYHR